MHAHQQIHLCVEKRDIFKIKHIKKYVCHDKQLHTYLKHSCATFKIWQLVIVRKMFCALKTHFQSPQGTKIYVKPKPNTGLVSFKNVSHIAEQYLGIIFPMGLWAGLKSCYYILEYLNFCIITRNEITVYNILDLTWMS